MSDERCRAEIVATAEAMLRGEIHLIRGCRVISSMGFSLDDSESEVLIPIIGAESETDDFPIGEIRSLCAPEYLDRMDAKMERYLIEARGEILDCCREIIRAFSQPSS